MWEGGGMVCVAQVGTTRMPSLYVGSWDTLPLVGWSSPSKDHFIGYNCVKFFLRFTNSVPK